MHRPDQKATGWITKIGYLIFGMMLCFFLINLLVFVFINPLAEALVKESISRGSQGLYTAQFDKLEIHIIGGDIKLSNFRLLPDAATLKARQKQGNPPTTIIHLTAQSLKVEDVDVVAYLRNKDIRIGGIEAQQPAVKVIRSSKRAKPKSNAPAPTINISAYLHALAINEINLKDGTFYFIEKDEKEKLQHEIRNVSVRLTDLRSDTLTAQKALHLLATGDLSIKVKDYIYHFPDSIYTCKLGTIDISTRQKALSIEKISIVPDTSIYQQRKRTGKAEPLLYGFDVEKVEIEDFDALEVYTSRKLAIDQVKIERPTVSIFYDQTIAKQPKPARTDAFKVLAEWLDQVTVQELALQEGKFTLHLQDKEVQVSQVVENVTVQLLNMQLDSLLSPDPKTPFYAEDIRVHVKNYTYYLPDSLYLLKVGEFSSSSFNRQIAVSDLQLIPRYSKAEFMQQIPYRTERKDFEIGSILLEEADLESLFNKQSLEAGSLTVQNARLHMYRDNRKPLDEKSRPKLLHQLIKEAPYGIDLRKVDLKDIYIQYEEIAEGGSKPGVITLENLQGRIKGVTNNAAKVKKGARMQMDIQAQLMGKAQLEVNFDFPLKSQSYTYQGKLSAIDAKELNKVIEPLVYMRLEDGQIQKAEFQVKADEDKARGSMKLYYTDLKVRLLEKESGNKAVSLKHDAGTFLANALVLKSNNPSGNKPLRVGDIDEIRDKRRSMIYHCVQSLMCGIRSSILTNSAERIVARKIEKKKAAQSPLE